MYHPRHALIIAMCFASFSHAMEEGQRKERKQTTEIVTAATAKTKISEMTPEQQTVAFRIIHGKLPTVLRSVTQEFYDEYDESDQSQFNATYIRTIQTAGIIQAFGVLNNGQIVSASDSMIQRWDPNNGRCIQTLQIADHKVRNYAHWVGGNLQFGPKRPMQNIWNARYIAREECLRLQILDYSDWGGRFVAHNNVAGIVATSGDFVLLEGNLVNTDRAIKVYRRAPCIYRRELSKIMHCAFKTAHAYVKWKKYRRPVSTLTATAVTPAATTVTPTRHITLSDAVRAFVDKQISVPAKFECALQ